MCAALDAPGVDDRLLWQLCQSSYHAPAVELGLFCLLEGAALDPQGPSWSAER